MFAHSARLDSRTSPPARGTAFSPGSTWYRVVVICGFLAGLYGLWAYGHAQRLRYIGVDEGVYTYIGWSWLNGYWPYLQAWDHKGPVVYAAAMLRVWLAGTGADALTGAELAIGAIIAALTASAGYLLRGTLNASIAFALAILLWTQRNSEVGTIAPVIALFSIAAVLCAFLLVRSPQPRMRTVAAVAAGLSGGLAFCTKPNGILGYGIALACIALSWLPRRERLRLILVSVGAAVLPAIIIALLFSRAGALAALVDAYFHFNSLKGVRILEFGPHRVAFRTLKSLNQLGLIAPVIFVVVVGSFVLLRERFKPAVSLRVNAGAVILLWLVCELFAMALNGGHLYHAAAVLPPLALAGAWIVSAALHARTKYRTALAGTAVVLLLVVPLIGAARLRPRHTDSGPRSPGWNRIVRDIQNETVAEDRVYALSTEATSIYLATHRRNPSRYVTLAALILRGYTGERLWTEMLAEFQAHPPKFIEVEKPLRGRPPEEVHPLIEAGLRQWRYLTLEEADIIEYPSTRMWIDFIAAHYRLRYCQGRRCLLEIATAGQPHYIR